MSRAANRFDASATTCRTASFASVALVIAFHVEAASAHAGTGLPGGIAQGFAHPFGGLDHLLAMVSVGLWGAFLG